MVTRKPWIYLAGNLTIKVSSYQEEVEMDSLVMLEEVKVRSKEIEGKSYVHYKGEMLNAPLMIRTSA